MFSIIIGLLLSSTAIFFAFQNPDIVTIKFFDNQITGTISLLIITSLLIGFLIAMIFFVPRLIADSWKVRSLKRENDQLKNRLNESPIQFEAPGLGSEGEKHIEIDN